MKNWNMMNLASEIIEFSTKNPGWAALILILVIVLIALGLLGFDVWRGYKKSNKDQNAKKELNGCGSNCPINTEKDIIVMIASIQKRINDKSDATHSELLKKLEEISKEINKIENSINESFPMTSELMNALTSEIKDNQQIISLLKNIISKTDVIINSISHQKKIL